MRLAGSAVRGALIFFEDDFLVLTVLVVHNVRRGVKLVPICEPIKHHLPERVMAINSESQYEYVVVPVPV